ncbi:MAG: site-specific integrase [Acidobacteria bacterium]|mgnify:CR=1 FL=1|nr:MAG: site-specific integrase [Acidobacteriota bacterium]
MAKRARFQHGWMSLLHRKTGDVWSYRFREYSTDGKPINRRMIVGPFSKYPTESDASRAVELMRLDVNRDLADSTLGPLMTIELLVAHFKNHELAEMDDPEENKASRTKDSYEVNFKNHILPRWGKFRLNEVRTIAIQDWLRGLKCTTKDKLLARGTKAKIRNMMHSLFSHAMRYEFIDRNPVTQVRQSAKREKIPEILKVDEFRSLINELGQMHRTMVVVAACSGLRRSELFALKWSDIDFDAKQASVTRSFVHNTKRERIGTCKTETSRKPVPLSDVILEDLALWRLETGYSSAENWVFASPTTYGASPRNPQNVMTDYIRPAAVKAGITKQIGWHTFRHSYTSLLKSNGEDIKVVQELLRHAISRITMDIYAQALTPAKRQAQDKVVMMVVPERRVRV